MPRCRCRCGALATTKRACLACGSRDHLIHCHCNDTTGPDGQPVYQDPDVVLSHGHWRNCRNTHDHPYSDPDHVHRESEGYT